MGQGTWKEPPSKQTIMNMNFIFWLVMEFLQSYFKLDQKLRQKALLRIFSVNKSKTPNFF